MCGIVGFVSYKEKYDLTLALESISHRGPDGRGDFYYAPSMELNVGFGHVRLSIIDIDVRSAQPFHSETGDYCIVYNGEIYNYKVLQEKYLNGDNFRTTSDTEVILKLYIKYGVSMFDWLEGMYAFVILDKKKEEIIVARDQIGIKPLYYAFSGKEFVFASEIKAFQALGIKPEIDYSLLGEYLATNFIYEPETGFKNIKKVPPGYYAVISYNNSNSKSLDLSFTQYWQLKKAVCNEPDVEKNIIESINSHTISDVPIGLFFSGGVDSSILLAILKGKMSTMTVKMPIEDLKNAGIPDDNFYAKEIANQLNIDDLIEVEFQQHKFDQNFFLQQIDDLAKKSEELLCDYTYYASAYLSKEARKKGLKVILSGMGADEVFGGYNRYLLVRHFRFFKKFRFFFYICDFLLGVHPYFSSKRQRFISFFAEQDFINAYSSTIGYFSLEKIKKILGSNYQDNFNIKLRKLLECYEEKTKLSYLRKAQILDLYGFLAHNFTIADKSSMEASLEMRVPLATKRLYEISFYQNDNFLVSGATTKAYLKKFLSRFIPKELIYRRKAGFNPPLANYINSISKEDIIEFMDKRGLFKVCNRNEIEVIINENHSKKSNNVYQIFSLMYLASWLNHYQ